MLVSFLLLPLVLAHKPLQRRHRDIVQRQPQPQPPERPLDPRGLHILDERLLPITTTTTVVVAMTVTDTVWVQPTDQVVFIPSAASSMTSAVESSSSMSSSASGSTNPSSAPSSTADVSAGPSSSVSVTQSASASSSTSSSLDASASSTISSSSSEQPSSSTSTTVTASASASDSAPSSSTSSPLSSSTSSASSASSSASLSSSSSSSSSSSLASLSDPASSSASISASASSSAASSVSSSAIISESASSDSSSTSTSISSASASASSSSSSAGAASSSLSSSMSSSSTSSVSTSASASASASQSRSVVASTSSSSSASVTSSSASSASSGVVSSTSSSASSSASSSSALTSPTLSGSASASSSLSSSSSSQASSSSTSSAPAKSPSAVSLAGPLMNGYYPDWSGWYLAPEDVDYTKFDVIDFAFALPTSSYGLEFTQDDSSDLLTRLVTLAHAAGKRVKLSIGGWTGSTYFSTICASSSARKMFVKNILAAYNSYNLDGIDIDWEYPGVQGAGNNAVSGSDSANFLTFLQELRAALPNGALISLATQVWPFADANGRPMTDVSGFAAVIDWILIMNYDVWGSSSTPGPNAPLSNACGNSTQPLANAYAAVASWTAAGMPANQITLGVPAYGYLQMSSASSLIQRRGGVSPRDKLPHRKANLQAQEQKRASYVTVYNDGGGTSDGQVMFEELVSQGALTKDSSGEYVGAGGFVREWDGCSSTPWLKSTHTGQIVTYDDPQSMSLKAQFALQAGLRGCNVFSMDGDWTGSAWPLTDAVRSGMGL